MTRTHEKVGYIPKGKYEDHGGGAGGDPGDCSVEDAEAASKVLEGRWKLVILFHLFKNPVMRFSELERAIPAISQKMLIQQLRALEADEVVERIVHPQVPPKVEYRLSELGRELEATIAALIGWAELRASQRYSASASR